MSTRFYKSNNDISHAKNHQQEIIIDFSSLSQEEKDIYMQHLMKVPTLSTSNNNVIDTIKINKYQPLQKAHNQSQTSSHTSRSRRPNSSRPNSSRPSNSAFTPAKTRREQLHDIESHGSQKNKEGGCSSKRSKNESHFEQNDSQNDQYGCKTLKIKPLDNEDSSRRLTLNKVTLAQTQVPLNQIVAGSQDSFPLFYSFSKVIDKWVRPKRFMKDQLQKLIEEILTTKFLKETQHLLAGKASSKHQQNIVPFPQHVFEILKKKFKQQKLLEQVKFSL